MTKRRRFTQAALISLFLLFVVTSLYLASDSSREPEEPGTVQVVEEPSDPTFEGLPGSNTITDDSLETGEESDLSTEIILDDEE